MNVCPCAVPTSYNPTLGLMSEKGHFETKSEAFSMRLYQAGLGKAQRTR